MTKPTLYERWLDDPDEVPRPLVIRARFSPYWLSSRVDRGSVKVFNTFEEAIKWATS
jgi:hypothetical protein